jgi:hypothetical protein
MKIGFILECSPKGPDADIYPYLAAKFCDKLTIAKPETLVNKKNVMNDGPRVAKTLLESGCDYVFVIWDRLPPWGGTGNCDEHIAELHAGLAALGVDIHRVFCCCIKDMLESWMIGDGKIITSYFQKFTNHKLEIFPDYKSSVEQSKPEEKLSRYNKRYNKFTDNFEIVKTMTDFKKIAQRNESFKFFKESVEAICP